LSSGTKDYHGKAKASSGVLNINPGISGPHSDSVLVSDLRVLRLSCFRLAATCLLALRLVSWTKSGRRI